MRAVGLVTPQTVTLVARRARAGHFTAAAQHVLHSSHPPQRLPTGSGGSGELASPHTSPSSWVSWFPLVFPDRRGELLQTALPRAAPAPATCSIPFLLLLLCWCFPKSENAPAPLMPRAIPYTMKMARGDTQVRRAQHGGQDLTAQPQTADPSCSLWEAYGRSSFPHPREHEASTEQHIPT